MDRAQKNNTPTPEFLKLLIGHQSDLYGYIGTLMGAQQGAPDVLQETNGKLLENWQDFDPLYPFLPWAFTIARYEVLTWRKRQSRDRLVLNDELLTSIAERMGNDSSSPDVRLEALKSCLKKLRPAARKMIESRYMHGESVGEMAGRLGRSVNALSVALFRIRKAILDCIQSTLAAKEGA